MKRILYFLRGFVIVALLTVLSQVGGLVYLLYLPIRSWIINKEWSKRKKRAARIGSFALLYLGISLLIVPMLALQLSGRRPLPWRASPEQPIAALNRLSCVLNRHYVDKEVYVQLMKMLPRLKAQLPGTTISYLDANFPFMDGFPLPPHLSHNDGRKLDIAFLYQDPDNQERKNGSPSFIGYGICEEPTNGEWDQAAYCSQKGYWQYNLLRQLIPQFGKQHYQFDAKGNRRLLEELAKTKAVRKIFIEPHLKTRLRLERFNKIRFHGCRAVRHDDHIHLEF